jgi:hypothetical protein
MEEMSPFCQHFQPFTSPCVIVATANCLTLSGSPVARSSAWKNKHKALGTKKIARKQNSLSDPKQGHLCTVFDTLQHCIVRRHKEVLSMIYIN